MMENGHEQSRSYDDYVKLDVRERERMVAHISAQSHCDDSMMMAYWLNSDSAQSLRLLLLNGSDNRDFTRRWAGQISWEWTLSGFHGPLG